jgi:hypothetical protein
VVAQQVDNTPVRTRSPVAESPQLSPVWPRRLASEDPFTDPDDGLFEDIGSSGSSDESLLYDEDVGYGPDLVAPMDEQEAVAGDDDNAGAKK